MLKICDQDPIFIRFNLSGNIYAMSDKIYHETVARHTCTVYRNILSVLLRDVRLPVDALQCRNPLHVSSEQVTRIHRYA